MQRESGVTGGLGRLKGQVSIVTGANSGIGRATAQLFAREGSKVVCCDIREVATPRVDALIRQEGGEAIFVQGDVASATDADRLATAALEAFGGIDILFNNVGVSVRKRIHERAVLFLASAESSFVTGHALVVDGGQILDA
jgi:NAD(P)-dependent dehydrogenase (short-subunit alcohol dehydrogenase family)